MKKVVELFKKQKLLIVIGIFILLGIVLSVSYALWSITKTQTNDNLVTVGCFDVDFVEVTDAITLSNALPITDTEGLQTSPYTFTLTNTCNIVASYQINVEVLPVDSGKTKLADEYVKIDINNSTSILSTNAEVEPTITGASKSYTIKTGILDNGDSETFNYRQWLDYDTTTVEGSNKQFKTKITIIAVASEIPCADCGILRVSEYPPSETTRFLNSPSPVLRNNIESIVFMNHKTIPGTAIGSWDVSATGDNSVVAWYEDTNSNSMYEITIGGVGGVKGNSNSTSLFQNIRNLDSIDFTHFYTHEVTNMQSMFVYIGYNSTAFTLDLGDKFDTSNVTIMSAMFSNTGYNSLNFILDLGDKFNTSNVTNTSSMFTNTGYNSTIFTLDLGDKFNTSSVTSMQSMFSYTGYSSSAFALNLGDKFDTSNVTNMNSMFDNTGRYSTVFTLDLGNKFDTSNVTIMSMMFFSTGCNDPNFTLDLRNFNVNAITTDTIMLATGNSSHRLYASDSNVGFISDPYKNFTGTIINCTTSPASCP